MAGCFICNFFRRTLLYQILIVIAALKLKNAFRYNKDFVQRIATFLSSIHLPEKLVNYLPKNKEYVHKGFLISLIVFASFSMIDVNFFKILSGIGCILLAFLYHNPLVKSKESLGKKNVFNFETFEENLPELEFILYICIAFAMFGNAFAEKVCPKDKDKEDDDEIPREIPEKQTNKGKGKKKDSYENKNKGGKNKGKKKKD